MRGPRLIGALFVLNLLCGCCFHKDLTGSVQVQLGGRLGESWYTTQQLDLVKDTHSRVLFLAKRGYPDSSRDRRAGVVDAGTGLCVNRVERVTELIAILVVLPEYYSWDCTLARIESGPYAGREVAIGGSGLLYKKGPATNGSPMLALTR